MHAAENDIMQAIRALAVSLEQLAPQLLGAM